MIKKRLDAIIKRKLDVIDVSDLPDRTKIRKEGYRMADDAAFSAYVSSYMSSMGLIGMDQMLTFPSMRDMKREYSDLKRLHAILPDNTPEPVVLVKDKRIDKDYVRGYILNTYGSLPIRETLDSVFGGRTTADYHARGAFAGYVMDQLRQIRSALEERGEYTNLPSWAFDASKIYITPKNKVMLLASTEDSLVFDKKDRKTANKTFEKTLKYLTKIKEKSEAKAKRMPYTE
jgi:hypothetical protein